MALYAYEVDDLIYAGEAEPKKIYWCLDCFGPVRRRSGRDRFPHFYHVKPAPQCRLYSKTEDHLLAQLDLQKRFAPGVLQIERPFLQINRVADLCWESEKIVFEIQCSPISPKEAEMRVADYGSSGYEVVWLLDDKRYNKWVARPAEEELRRQASYYLAIHQQRVYDQFEIFSLGRRVKRSRRMLLDLQHVRRFKEIQFDPTLFPKQIVERNQKIYFANDRLFRALNPTYAFTMQNWRALEILLIKKKRRVNRLLRWWNRHIAPRLSRWLDEWVRRNTRKSGNRRWGGKRGPATTGKSRQ